MTLLPNFHDIERLAYFLYLSRGRQEGQALTHWLEAETQLSEYNTYRAQNAGTSGFSAQVLPAGDPQS